MPVELNTELDRLGVARGGGLGDYSIDDKLLIFCGDSTTEQMGGAGFGFDRFTTLHRQNGGAFSKVLGTINFGGSGNTLSNFVSAAAATPPVIQAETNAGVGAWDYYGHKPTGAISLGTALAWREGKAGQVLWVVCFGINDCILYNAVGNLSQQEITDYLAPMLRTAVNRILAAYPQDRVVLRVPNPMTARPYSAEAGFPSAAQYPDFGTDLAADQALVNKWNHGIRNAYLAVRNELSKTVLFDTWEQVFGDSDTTRDAGTGLPFLGDLVHPSGSGYVGLADAFVEYMAPSGAGLLARRAEAVARASNLGNQPWENFPRFFQSNPSYKLAARTSGFIGIGSNYIDVRVPLEVFSALVDRAKPLYVVIGDQAAQEFTGYSASVLVAGTSIRLLSVAPSAAMQAAKGNIELYQASSTLKTTDSYLISRLDTLKSRNVYYGKVGGAGAGYIDVTFDANEGRFSSKWKAGLKFGKLEIGGGADTSLSLASATVYRSGTSAQRSVRFSIAGDQSAYAGKPVALVFDDSAPSPHIHEHGAITQRGVVPHSQGARGFVHCPYEMLDGATLSVFLTELIAQDVVVEVYRARWSTRTLIGTITAAANASGGTLAAGNPTTVEAGTIYEFVVTSATSQATGLVGLAVTPA